MSMQLPPLVPSEPKFRFISRLGIDRPETQHIYAIMKNEAELAWRRLQFGRDGLLLHLQNRDSVRPPFAHGQINEEALAREVHLVFVNADPQTRPYYQMAHEPGTTNWIIRWLIWHVFRDRDQRKKPRRGVTQALQQDEDTVQQPIVAESSAQAAARGRPPEYHPGIESQQQVTEPASVASPDRLSDEVAGAEQVDTVFTEPPPRIYLAYDPVRDL